MVKRENHQSDLNLFEFCGECFRLEKIEGKRGRGNFFIARGRGLHRSREHNFRQKILSFVDLPVDDLKDAARDEIVKSVNEDKIALVEELAGLGKKGASAKIIRHTLPMVERDRELLMPRVQPWYVEKILKVELPDWPFDLTGKLDVIGTDEFIYDSKTSINKMSQADADDAYQGTHYWLMGRAFLGHNPKGFKYHVLVETKSGKRFAYELETTRTEKQIYALMLRYERMDKAIKAGIFAPCHRGSWKCSPKWCSQFTNCQFVQK